ncbi:MAG TPA: hypothetical protein VIG06_10705 [Kofleriaceae bacterium]
MKKTKKNETRDRRRLILSRQTLRVLSSDELEAAAGGDAPKTNAWTGLMMAPGIGLRIPC